MHRTPLTVEARMIAAGSTLRRDGLLPPAASLNADIALQEMQLEFLKRNLAIRQLH